jgi:hypothetical protein
MQQEPEQQAAVLEPVEPRSPRVLYGTAAIAGYLGLRPKQAEHLIAAKRFPTFRIGRRPAARPETLDRWLAEEEALADA